MKGMIIKYGALEMIQAQWQKAFEAGDGRERVDKIKAHQQLQDYRKLIGSGIVMGMTRFIIYNNDKIITWKDVLYGKV